MVAMAARSHAAALRPLRIPAARHTRVARRQVLAATANLDGLQNFAAVVAGAATVGGGFFLVGKLAKGLAAVEAGQERLATALGEQRRELLVALGEQRKEMGEQRRELLVALGEQRRELQTALGEQRKELLAALATAEDRAAARQKEAQEPVLALAQQAINLLA
jgi:hypothetical protein